MSEGSIAQKTRFETLHSMHWPAIEALILENISSVCEEDSLLYQMILYQLQTGGKRLRAILPLLVGETMSHDLLPLLRFGAACEALHNASVVHDDLQDGDAIRRGQLTVWSRFGLAQAVNLGDALVACAFSLAQELDVPSNLRDRVFRQMLFQMLRATDGQVRDLELKPVRTTCIEEYMLLVEAKTAGFFVLPITGAAVLCGADKSTEDGLRQAASHLGVLFQVQDDIVDTLAKTEVGESARDLLQGNRSTLIRHCLQTAGKEESQWLERLLNKPRGSMSPQDIKLAQELIVNTGSLNFALAKIDLNRSLALTVPIVRESPKLGVMIESICEICLSSLDSLRNCYQMKLPNKPNQIRILEGDDVHQRPAFHNP